MHFHAYLFKKMLYCTQDHAIYPFSYSHCIYVFIYLFTYLSFYLYLYLSVNLSILGASWIFLYLLYDPDIIKVFWDRDSLKNLYRRKRVKNFHPEPIFFLLPRASLDTWASICILILKIRLLKSEEVNIIRFCKWTQATDEKTL